MRSNLWPDLPSHTPVARRATSRRQQDSHASASQNIVWQEMDSKALKRAYGMEPHQKGVLVRALAGPACAFGRPHCLKGASAGRGGTGGTVAAPVDPFFQPSSLSTARLPTGPLRDSRQRRGLCPEARRHCAAHRRRGRGQRRHGALPPRRARRLQVRASAVPPRRAAPHCRSVCPRGMLGVLWRVLLRARAAKRPRLKCCAGSCPTCCMRPGV